jgi:hypothetical protein
VETGMGDDETSYIDKTTSSTGQNRFPINAAMEPEIDYEIDYFKACKRPQILAALAGAKLKMLFKKQSFYNI